MGTHHRDTSSSRAVDSSNKLTYLAWNNLEYLSYPFDDMPATRLVQRKARSRDSIGSRDCARQPISRAWPGK